MASLAMVSSALWAAQPLLEGAVVYSLWRRKLHKDFPFFFRYLLAQIAMFCVLFPIDRWASDAFFFRYWYYLDTGATAIGIALGIKVLHEISMDVFRPFDTLQDLGTVLFRWAALVMLLVGVVVAASTTSDMPILEQSVTAVHRCVRLAQMGLVLFLMLFSSYFRIHWRHRSFGLALGFGFVATTELVIEAMLLNGKGLLSHSVASAVLTLSYLMSLFIWLAYSWIKSPTLMTEPARLKTQRWDRGLTEIQHPVAAESLIPMFEGMVERALARSTPMPPAKDSSLEGQALAQGTAVGQ